MNCRDFIELIDRQISGLATRTELEELKQHLAGCPACKAEFRLQTRIHQALAEPMPRALPGDFAERVSRRAVAEARRQASARRLGYLLPIFATASLVVLAIVYRADIAGALAPLFGAIGERLSYMIAWMGAGASEATRTLGSTRGLPAGSATAVLAQTIRIWASALVAIAAIGWALFWAYAFLRK